MKSLLSSSSSSSCSSWEEKAFAEDMNNNNNYSNGSVWPPKSYSCSFCMREFKSAQALGGHMNIHRRDRARLKQCCPTNNNNNNHYSRVSKPLPYSGHRDSLSFENRGPTQSGLGSETGPDHDSVPRLEFCGDVGEKIGYFCKRPKLMYFFFKPCCDLQYSEVNIHEGNNNNNNNNIIGSNIDGLDLELRLGHYPKK